MRHLMTVLLAAAVAACDDTPRPTEPGSDPITLTLSVNLQMNDTPVGQRPEYILVGAVSAKQSDVAVEAFVDSVVVSYRVADGQWVWFRRYAQFPNSAQLPFSAVENQTYDVRAVLFGYARGYDGRIERGSRERIVTRKGYVPAP